MHADPLRVTVLVGGRRSDVAVPAGLPVAELLPELVGRDPDVASPDTTRHLALPGGRPLDPEVTLQDQGVRAGAVLVLTSAAPLPPVPDDPAEALGAEVARAAPWTGRHRDAVRPVASCVLALVAAAGVVGHPDPAAGGAVGAGGALTLLALAAWSSRSGRARAATTAVLAVVLACLLAAAAAAAVTAAVTVAATAAAATGAPVPERSWLGRAGPPVGAAVVVTALAGAAALTRRRGLLVAAVLPGATLTVLGMLARGPAPPEGLVAGAVVGLVLLGGAVPAAALAVVGRGGDPLVDPYGAAGAGAGDPDRGDLGTDTARAADLLAGTAGGVGIVLAVAAPLLAVTGRSAAVLAAVLAVHLLLRARRSHATLLVAADLGCGSVALAGVVGVLLATDPAARVASAPALVLAVPVVLLLGPVTSVGARRLGDLAETATAVALLPLLAVVTGLLDLVGG